MNPVTTFEVLSSSHSKGVIVVAVFALVSAIALAFICGRTIRLGVKILLHREDEKIPEMLFFCTQLGHYAASLVLSNVFITVAGLVEFSWISSSGVSAGSACQAQAILMQIGIWGTCFFTVAHGVHTCNSLILRLRQPRWLSAVVMAIGWAIALVAALGPLHDSNAYGPSGISCGIASGNNMEIFALEALPIILAAALSIIVYVVIFLALSGKNLRISGMDKLRKLNLKAQRGLDEFEEYRRFISAIIRTMFWFPFAFVVLLLPFCIVHLMMYAGCTVPYAADVFAHVCCSMLGFANVFLLANTFRVVSPVFNGPKQDAVTVKTFGNDASGESPINQEPHPSILSREPAIPSYNRSDLMRKSGHFANHSHASSTSSADSSTGLLKHEKSRKYNQSRVAHAHNIVPPAELNRQMDELPSSQKRISGLQIAVSPGSEALVSPGLVTVSLSPPPPRIPSAGERLEAELSAKEKKRLVRQTTEAFGKSAKDLAFKSKAPPALDLPSSLVPPPPLSMREVANKSVTLATRLGITPKPQSPAIISAASAFGPPRKQDKGKGKALPPPVTPVRRKSKVRRPSVVLEVRPFDLLKTSGRASIVRSDSRSSISSSASGESSGSRAIDESDYSQDSSTVVIRPLPGAPESTASEDSTDSDASSDVTPQRRRAQRTKTMDSVWSQDSLETANEPLHMESYLAMLQAKAKARAMKGPDDVPGRAPAGPRAPKSARPVKLASNLSARFTRILSPERSPVGSKGFKMVLAPNDSAV